MLKKIFKFIKGYVIIEISGKNKERFINMCLAEFLPIYDVVPHDGAIRLKTDRAGFILMRAPARKCGVRVKIVGRCGAREVIGLYRRRIGFVAAGAAVCIFFLMLPQYILCVEIDGAYSADTEQITEILRQNGVYTGAKKKNMSDLGDIKKAVVFGTEGVSWAWLYDEGARMRLRIQEKKPIPVIRDKTVPTDIVAVCDGWIKQADIYRGERHINAGMMAAEGDTLVSGRVAVFAEGEPEKYMLVHSDARIIADTIRTESGSYGTSEKIRIKTGRKKRRLSLELFGKRYDLYRNIGGGFDDYDVTDRIYDLDLPVVGYAGISAAVHTAFEVNTVRRRLSEKEVLDRAREELEMKICKKLGTGAVKQDEKLTYSTDGNKYNVELRMYLRENIGMEIPIEEMKTVDKTNDRDTG